MTAVDNAIHELEAVRNERRASSMNCMVSTTPCCPHCGASARTLFKLDIHLKYECVALGRTTNS